MATLAANAERCIGKCHGDFHTYRCSHKATIGKFCKIHDPDTANAKRAAREAIWRKEFAEKGTQRQIRHENECVGEYLRRLSPAVFQCALNDITREKTNAADLT